MANGSCVGKNISKSVTAQAYLNYLFMRAGPEYSRDFEKGLLQLFFDDPVLGELTRQYGVF
jgi:hypothetical protein